MGEGERLGPSLGVATAAVWFAAGTPRAVCGVATGGNRELLLDAGGACCAAMNEGGVVAGT